MSSLLKSNKRGFIFDGFPRTIDQGEAFQRLLDELNLSISSVLYFNLSLHESITRISGRLIDSRNNNVYHKFTNPAPEEVKPYLITRKDDTPEKVTHRYNVYIEETSPLLKFYESKLVKIDCLNSIEDISAQIVRLLESFQLSR